MLMTTKTTGRADVIINYEKPVWAFWPQTPRAKRWITSNVNTDAHHWSGPRLFVRHRAAVEIRKAMQEASLVCRVLQ